MTEVDNSKSADLETNATAFVQPQEPTNFVLYRAPAVQSSSTTQNIPDSFFEASGTDLKMAQSNLAARTQALTNAPLMTQAMRESSQKSKRDRWPTTNIRIRFHDRMQLEKTFSSSQTIKSVAMFLRSALKAEMQPNKFVLYQAPPIREFRVSDPEIKGKSLYDLQLAPSSILYVKFLEDKLNSIPISDLLSDHVLSQAQDLPALSAEPTTSSSTPTPRPASNNGAGNSTGTTGTTAKMPKWLKLGKK